MSKQLLIACVLGLISSMAALPAYASKIVYEPINPSFGGNPGNAGQLLGVANAQNDYSAPKPHLANSTNTQATQFLQQLQSRFLSSLAANVTEAIFGNNPQERGEIVFGDQTIIFERGLSAVQIDIVEASTGQRTTISVPLLLTGK